MSRFTLTTLLGILGLIFLQWSVQSGWAFPIKEWDTLTIGSDQKLDPKEIRPGKPWNERLSGMKLLWIPGGCFDMGSPPNAENRSADEGPVHQVCLSGFWLGEKEMNQLQWRSIMSHNPAQFRKGDTYPVENVSRLDIEALTEKLNRHYRGMVHFELPTEAQWEYACRMGGQRITYPGSNQVDQVGWFQDNSNGTTQVGGTRLANGLGLFDMSGNVWEWVRDNYDKKAYKKHTLNDPLKTSKSPFIVIRGGGWGDDRPSLRCANRGFGHFTKKRSSLGLRLAASVDVYVEGESLSETVEMPF